MIIETHTLSHRYGDRFAVKDLDLAVPEGAVFAFLGPNGSGKTTTIRILLGLLRPQSGSVSILGLSMPKARRTIARAVGAMVEAPCLYDHLSGFDNIELTRRALDLERTETWRVLELVELSAFAKQRAGTYSLGMRQRLAIARALLGRPKLLILDEPTNGLDPAGVIDMRRLIRALPEREGASVFVSSHLLGEVEQIADNVGLMNKGRLIAQSSLTDLLASAGQTIALGVKRAPEALLRLKAANIEGALSGEDGLDVAMQPGLSPAGINRLLVQDGFDVFALAVKIPTLEDVFLQRTGASC